MASPGVEGSRLNFDLGLGRGELGVDLGLGLDFGVDFLRGDGLRLIDVLRTFGNTIEVLPVGFERVAAMIGVLLVSSWSCDASLLLMIS